MPSAEAEIDLAVAAALEADPLAHAVMHARFRSIVPAVNTDIAVDLAGMNSDQLIDSAQVPPSHADIMKRRFGKLALA